MVRDGQRRVETTDLFLLRPPGPHGGPVQEETVCCPPLLKGWGRHGRPDKFWGPGNPTWGGGACGVGGGPFCREGLEVGVGIVHGSHGESAPFGRAPGGGVLAQILKSPAIISQAWRIQDFGHTSRQKSDCPLGGGPGHLWWILKILGHQALWLIAWHVGFPEMQARRHA